MTTITPEQEAQLEALYAKYSEVRNQSAMNAHGMNDTPSEKRTQTLRFRKFYKLAVSFGYDMAGDCTKCMFASNN